MEATGGFLTLTGSRLDCQIHLLAGKQNEKELHSENPFSLGKRPIDLEIQTPEQQTKPGPLHYRICNLNFELFLLRNVA